MASPRLSVIVCTYRRPRQVLRLLRALDAQRRPADEIWIVDGSPDDDTERALGETRPGAAVRYHRVAPEERGLTRQRNAGIARAGGELIAFLDDDTEPEPAYLEELLACFARHPRAVGVGGYLTEIPWQRLEADAPAPPGSYRHGDWARREDLRWRLRRRFGLASPLPPGLMPPCGHPRPVGYLPPDGADHRVEFIMGGAAAWRRSLFETLAFSPYFAGYGLYEDLEFCLRAGAHGALYLATRARLAHHHAAGGRPHRLRYGTMVVRNGYLVWRRRWPRPPRAARARWWATSALLTACLAADALRGRPLPALAETAGRLWGMVTVLARPPRDRHV